MRVATLVALALLTLPSAAAHANCNLIPSAVTALGSSVGKVDRPIASPGQTVTVLLDFACNPASPGFSPVLGNNFVRLVFEPPGSASNPSLVTDVSVVPLSVSDCGPNRCAALSFVVPDTDDLLPPVSDGLGLVGPASIVVEDGAGTRLATIDDLYQPTLSCSDHTPDPIFEHFVVLPPPNVVPNASASGQTVDVVMQAAVDGGGDLLIPINYSGVLPSGNGGPLARILDATWDLPAFEGNPTPIVFPNNGFAWIRAFSDVGRAIPPFLEIGGTGEGVSGSVDAMVSILHIQNDDGQGPIFDLAYRLVDGRGPIIINDPVQITVGGAVPLESLTTFADTAVFVVDEAAQGQDLDGDGLLQSQVVQIKDVATGNAQNTGQAVTVASFDGIHKQALANNGHVVAFLQSEAASHVDLATPGEESGDGDRLDDALRVYDSQGGPIAPASLPIMADALPVVNDRSLAVTSGDLVVFTSREGDESFPTTELVSVATDGAPANGGAWDPDLSEDGQDVAFYSSSSLFLPDTAPVYDETTFSSTIVFDGSAGSASASTRFDSDYHSWPLTVSSVDPVPIQMSLVGNAATGYTTGQFDFTIGDSASGLEITSSDATGSYYTCAAGTWPDSCTPGAVSQFEIGQQVVLEATIPDANFYLNTDLVGDLRARKPRNVAQWRVQIVGTVTNLDGQNYVVLDASLQVRAILQFVSQIYVRDRDTNSLELVSRSPVGGPATDYSSYPSISGDGDVVAYTTMADTVTNEVDDNGLQDIIRWRRSDQSSEFVSYNVNQGAPGNSASYQGVVSGDGSTIAFVTAATNLYPPAAPTDANGAGTDILIYDVASRTIVDRITGPGGVQPDGPVGNPDISWDGNVIAFESYAGNFDPPSSPSDHVDVFRFDRTTRELVRVTKAPDGGPSDLDSVGSLSLGGDDGRYLAFPTDATNLIGDGLGSGRHLMVWDHETGKLERIDLTTAGALGDGTAEDPVMSRDGQRVAFRSLAANLQDDTFPVTPQAYLYDRVTNALDVYSIGTDGEKQGAGGGTEIALSGDGYTVGWSSNDSGLVPGDGNGGAEDVFVRGVKLATATDLNGNGHGGDRVLRVLDAGAAAPGLRPAAQVQVERASVAAGRVATLTSESALVPAPGVDQRVALVAGGVADSNGDGLGDNVGIPGYILPGNTTGGPGQDGLTRFHAEFDVSGIDLARLASARVRLYIAQPGGSSQSMRFYHVRPPFNGSLDPFDFQLDARAVSGAPVLPPSYSGYVEVDVTSEIVRVLNSGYSIYGFQARSANEGASGYTAEIRTTLTNIALPPEQRPTLIVEQSGYIGQNADSDADDQVMFVYDGNTDMMTPLGLSARSVQISDQVLCAIVSENDEGTGAGYTDINGNGVPDDGLLFVSDLSSYPPDPIYTGFEATQVVASGPYCYFTRPEAGVDRTGDGDGTDQVAEAFDVLTGQLVSLMATTDENGDPLPAPQELAAQELVAAGDWVAFRTCESDQGRRLNRDGDSSDCVMQIADARTGEVENTLRAAEKCTFPGCDPFFEPYRLRVLPNPETGDEVVTLSFVTFEPTQGGEMPGEGCLPTSPDPSCDLTTDGDDLDFVVQVFNPASGRAQAIEVSPETTVPPFPTTSFDEDVIILQLPCEAAALPGVECGTAESPDTLTVVVPDSDGDGTFDSSNTGDDNCADYNPDQADADADGLGASCDPDTDPVTMQETTTPEQELPGGAAKECELTGDGVIDQSDVDLIFGDRGQKAQPSDPRDPDADGQITVLDARYCVTRCTNPDCEPSASTSSCGFLGIEALVVLVPWWLRRRRTR